LSSPKSYHIRNVSLKCLFHPDSFSATGYYLASSISCRRDEALSTLATIRPQVIKGILAEQRTVNTFKIVLKFS